MNEKDASQAASIPAPRALDRPRDIALWRNINFQLMWSSIFASGFGDRLVQMAAWGVLGISAAGANAASITAGVTFFFFLPYLVFSPIGGLIADRLPRKWIMFVCDESRGVLLLATVGYIWFISPAYQGEAIPKDNALYDTAVYSTYALIFCTGIFAAIFGPTRDAMTPQIVPMRQLQSANALILAIASIAAMIGMAVGGYIIDHAGVRSAIFVAAACYLVTGSFWAFVKPVKHTTILSPEERKTRSRGFGPAISYVIHHRRLIMLFLIALLFWALAYIFLSVLAAVCKSPAYFNITDSELKTRLGILSAALGVGMLVSSAALMVIKDMRHAPKMILGGLFLSGLMLLIFWLNTSYTLGLILAVGVGFFSNFARVGADTLTQAITANYIRGRIFGLREILITVAAIVVNYTIWQLPDADTMMITILPFTALTLITISAIGFWFVRHTGPKRVKAPAVASLRA